MDVLRRNSLSHIICSYLTSFTDSVFVQYSQYSGRDRRGAARRDVSRPPRELTAERDASAQPKSMARSGANPPTEILEPGPNGDAVDWLAMFPPEEPTRPMAMRAGALSGLDLFKPEFPDTKTG
jgi:hypothetical protein